MHELTDLQTLAGLLSNLDRSVSGTEPGPATKIVMAYLKSQIAASEEKQRKYEEKKRRPAGERGLASDE